MATPVRKKPDCDFMVRLVGSGIRPWAVPMRSLAKVLEATQRLVDQREEEDEDTKPDDEESPQGDESEAGDDDAARTLRLLGVKSASAGYAVTSPSRTAALHVLSETGSAIQAPDKTDWSDATLSSLRDLSEVAKKLGCEIEFRRPGKGKDLGGVIAKITPTTYAEVAATAFVTGTTSIIGKLEKVGGASQFYCGLRLVGEPRMLSCRVVDAPLIRSLGQYMYQTILASGEATWLRHNWHVKHFKITSFEPPKIGSVRDALKLAYDAGGKAWDKIENPDKYIAEMRG